MIKEFLKYKKDIIGCSDGTISLYEQSLNMLHSFANRNIETLTQKDILDWLSFMKDNNVSAVTRNNRLSPIKEFFKYLNDIKEIGIDEKILKITNSKTPKREKVILKSEHIDSIIDIAPNYLVRALVYIIYKTGMRYEEIMQMTVNDIGKDNFKFIGKGNKERIVYFTKECVDMIVEYNEKYRKNVIERTKKDTSLLWLSQEGNKLKNNNFNITLKNVARKIGFDEWKKITIHSLRHTAATTWLKNGATIKDVSVGLGHDNISTTNRYVHSNDDDIKTMMIGEVNETLKEENLALKQKILELEEFVIKGGIDNNNEVHQALHRES